MIISVSNVSVDLRDQERSAKYRAIAPIYRPLLRTSPTEQEASVLVTKHNVHNGEGRLWFSRETGSMIRTRATKAFMSAR